MQMENTAMKLAGENLPLPSGRHTARAAIIFHVFARMEHQQRRKTSGTNWTSWISNKTLNHTTLTGDANLDLYLKVLKGDGDVKKLTVVLDMKTIHDYTPEQKANVMKQYKNHIANISKISYDKIDVVGSIEKGDKNKTTVTIKVN